MSKKHLNTAITAVLLGSGIFGGVQVCQAKEMYLTTMKTTQYDEAGNETGSSASAVKTYAVAGGSLSVSENSTIVYHGVSNQSTILRFNGDGSILSINNTVQDANQNVEEACLFYFAEGGISYVKLFDNQAFDKKGKATQRESTTYTSTTAKLGDMSGFTESRQSEPCSYEYDDQGRVLTTTMYDESGNETQVVKYEYTDGQTITSTYSTDGSLISKNTVDSETMQGYKTESYMGRENPGTVTYYEYSQEPVEAASVQELYQGIWTIDLTGTGMEDWFSCFHTSPDDAFESGQALYVNNVTGTVQYFMEGDILDAAINPENPSQIYVWDTEEGTGAKDFSAPYLILTYEKETDTFLWEADGTSQRMKRL